jgi:hypothetical protein
MIKESLGNPDLLKLPKTGFKAADKFLVRWYLNASFE